MALNIRLSDCILRKGMTAAKNYLSEGELNLLNLIVDQCLFFPNAQAKQKRGMTEQNVRNIAKPARSKKRQE